MIEISARLYRQATQAEDAIIGSALINPSVLATMDLTPEGASP